MRLLWLILLSLFCTVARADDLISTTRLDYDIDLTTYNIDYNAAAPIFENNLLDQVTFNSWIPGTLKIKYIGIHGALLDQAKKYIKHEARRRINILYHNGGLTNDEADEAFSNLSGSINPYGDWWDRQWFHSLPYEKGGAPNTVETVYIGHHIQIPDNWGAITWVKDQFEALGDIWIRSDHTFEGESGTGLIIPEDSEETTKEKTDINKLNDLQYRGTAVIVEGQELDYEWFKGSSYHLRFRPSIRIKGGPEAIDIVDEVSIAFAIELFKSKKRVHFADIDFFVKYNIPDEDLTVSVNFRLLTW